MLRTPLRWIRSFLFSIPLILVFTVILGSIGYVASLTNRQGKILESCRRLWARLILAASFVRVTTTGLSKIDFLQTYLLCSNHLSYLDPPVILASVKKPVCFLAKQSLFAIPFLGWVMRKAGDVPLNREDPRQASASLEKAVERIREGISIIVFPEGTRSRDGQLQPFLSGAFRLAIETQIPVLPLAICGTREALPPDSLYFRGGHVQLLVGEPIPTRGMMKQDRDRLAEQTRQRIEKLLREASPGVLAKEKAD
ncbi:MAG: 1-acyl-sn-glycerol-3-phosphate acyltransferase [Acidobacteria bacterium]|nr:1-acyl-sn-glycerol-3-phosphate acyltransferase [Acidobacteriota bacterium]